MMEIWKNEPNELFWIDEETGYPCVIRRNYFGALCGYVAIDRTHPWWGWNYARCPQCVGYRCEHAPERCITIHGGLTFSGTLKVPGLIPEKIANDDWWFGFDTAHAGDFIPRAPFNILQGTYRDVSYVKEECKMLAQQLSNLAK